MFGIVDAMIFGPLFGAGAMAMFYIAGGIQGAAKKARRRKEKKNATPAVYADFGQLFCANCLREAAKVGKENGVPAGILLDMANLANDLRSHKMDRQKTVRQIETMRSSLFMAGIDNADVDYILGQAAGALRKGNVTE